MDLDSALNLVLNETGNTFTDKLPIRRLLTYKDLYRALIKFDTFTEVSLELNLTQDIVEKIMYRNIQPLFPDKLKGVKWGSFLLSLIAHKKCNTCNNILSIDSYVQDKSIWDTFARTCRACKAIHRNNFTLNNPNYNKINYNKSEYIARAIKYKCNRIVATPKWANLSIIKEMYLNCPDGYHVDHIIPLQGKLVCGLHVENNLQYLSVQDNLKKSNKFFDETN